jgi:Tfp pilus assembly protein PilP
MRKTIIIILILCAVPLYSYNIYLLLWSSPGANKSSASQAKVELADSWFIKTNAVTFVQSSRDPFSPYKTTSLAIPTEKKETRPETSKQIVIKKEIQQPSLKITGIMWSESNPVAMVVLPNGNGSVVKQGGVYSDITVKKIERNRLQITYQGQSFWVEK